MSTCPYTPKPEFARFLASSERSISLSGYELYKIEPCGWPESISHLQVIRGCRAMARKFDITPGAACPPRRLQSLARDLSRRRPRGARAVKPSALTCVRAYPSASRTC